MLVLLHGANGAARELAPLTDKLPRGLPTFAPDMLAHGGRDLIPELSIADAAADVLQQCDAAGIGRADWFGYSFGGLVALWIAIHHPERVRSLAALATKVAYDANAIAHVTHLLDPERLERIPRGAELARTHHPQDWRALARINQAMFARFAAEGTLSAEQLGCVTQPVLLMAGMKDPLVSPAETQALAAMLPRAATGIGPNTCHPLAQAPLDPIVGSLTRFLADPDKLVRAARTDLLRYRWDSEGPGSLR